MENHTIVNKMTTIHTVEEEKTKIYTVVTEVIILIVVKVIGNMKEDLRRDH